MNFAATIYHRVVSAAPETRAAQWMHGTDAFGAVNALTAKSLQRPQMFIYAAIDRTITFVIGDAQPFTI